MLRKNLEFGKIAEKEAVEFLKTKGYNILKVNYKTKLGEIDIIGQDKDTICFVEVKARHSLDFGQPCEAVSFKKQMQISKAAVYYLKINNLIEHLARFDVLSILYQGNVGEMSLIKNAFELSSRFTI
ncbi:MAG: YraN family protein [Candidatus Omnitrophota bacterium]